jgi:hypothetical protein
MDASTTRQGHGVGDAHMEQRMADLQIQIAENRADLRNHIMLCDRRVSILQKLCWWILGLVGTAVLLILKGQFKLQF